MTTMGERPKSSALSILRRYGLGFRRTFLAFAAIGTAAIVLLTVTYGVLHYVGFFEDTDGNRVRATEAAFRFVVWDEPTPLPGDANALYGNLEAAWAGDTMIVSRWVGEGDTDLFLSTRTAAGEWTKPRLLRLLRSDGHERSPWLSEDGRFLLFSSDREGGQGGFDLYLSQRNEQGWTRPQPLSHALNSEANEFAAAWSPTQASLILSSDRPGTLGAADLFRARVTWTPESALTGLLSLSRSDVVVAPLAHLNSSADERDPAVSSLGQVTFVSDRADGLGGYDLYRGPLEARTGEAGAFNLGGPVNSAFDERGPSLEANGYALRYVTNRVSQTTGDFAFLETVSREVNLRIDAALLRDLILALGLLTLTALLLHALFKLLTETEGTLSLVARCAVASLLLHLILAALSGTWMFSSRAGESLRETSAPMTVNLNALARESVALAVRESLQSLPASTPNPSTERAEVPLEAPTPAANAPAPLPAPTVVDVPTEPSFTPAKASESTEGGAASPALPKLEIASDVAPLSLTTPKLVLESRAGATEASQGNDEGERESEVETPRVVRRPVPETRPVDPPPPAETLPPVDTNRLARLTSPLPTGSPEEATAAQPTSNLDRGALQPGEEKALASAPVRQTLAQSLGLVPMPNILRFRPPPDQEIEESPELGLLTRDPRELVALWLALPKTVELRRHLQNFLLENNLQPDRPSSLPTAARDRIAGLEDPGRVGAWLTARLDPFRITADSELEVPESYLD